MTPALQKAIALVLKLPEKEQDAVAAIIEEEIAGDLRWNEAFANSQDVLARLAEQGHDDIRNGRIREAGFDDL